jgi:hypothetical protein
VGSFNLSFPSRSKWHRTRKGVMERPISNSQRDGSPLRVTTGRKRLAKSAIFREETRKLHQNGPRLSKGKRSREGPPDLFQRPR